MRYPYLWHWQNARGESEGRKDRPTTVAAAFVARDNLNYLLLLPGLCCKIRVLGVLNPFRGFPLRDSVGDGDSERGEAVEYGDTDVKLCDLTVKIPC